MRNISDDILLKMFSAFSSSNDLWAPKADIYETADDIIVKFCASGLDPEKIDITVSPDSRLLIIRGVRIEVDDDRDERIRYYQLELYYGEFERVVSLPRDVVFDKDVITATYKSGFLKIRLPKRKTANKKIIVN